jgi:hypothetical protein
VLPRPSDDPHHAQFKGSRRGNAFANNLVPNEASKLIDHAKLFRKRLMCGHFSLLMNPGGR